MLKWNTKKMQLATVSMRNTILRLKAKDLFAFADTARLGSMSAAAKHNGVSQSSISKSIAELEDMLGMPLFKRTKDGLELTEVGEMSLVFTKQLYDVAEASITQLRIFRGGSRVRENFRRRMRRTRG